MAELLVCISIVVILVSLMTPVAGAAKAAARESSSAARLKQIYIASMLYQAQWDSRVTFGKASDMGLPTFSGWVQNWMGLDEELRRSPCRGMNPYRGVDIYLWGPDDHPGWERDAQQYGDRMFMVQDQACNSADVDIHSVFAIKKGLCVTLGGAIIQRRAMGDWSNPEWWGATRL